METESIKQVLRQNFVVLVENLCNINSILNNLFQKEIFSSNEVELVHVEKTSQRKSQKLIDLFLQRCTKENYKEFVEILKATHNLHIVQELEKSQEANQNILEEKIPLERSKILPGKWWPSKKWTTQSFVPRQKDGRLIVEILREMIEESASMSTAVVATKQMTTISGLGGIGKTTTAKWFANHYEDDYNHIIWIDSEGKSLENSWRHLASDLKIPQEFSKDLPKSVSVLVNEIYTTLTCPEGSLFRCLFIFDNAENYNGENGLQDFLPKGSVHHTLITSRNREWGTEQGYGKIEIFPLDVFTEEDANTFVIKALKPEKLSAHTESKEEYKDDLSQLAQELGRLPLALQYAVATMNRSSTLNIGSYLSKIRSNNKFLLEKMNLLDDYKISIMKTLQITIDQIKQNEECGKLSVDILNIASFCEPDDIPEEYFQNCYKDLDKIDIEFAIDLLVQYSLVNVTLKEPELHDDEAIVQYLRERDRERLSETVVRKLEIHRLLQQVVQLNLNNSVENVTSILKVSISGTKNIPQRQQFARHAFKIWSKARQHEDIVKEYGTQFAELSLLLLGEERIKFIQESQHVFEKVFSLTDLPMLQIKLSLCGGLNLAKYQRQTLTLAEDCNRIISEKYSTNIYISLQMKVHLGMFYYSAKRYLDSFSLHISVLTKLTDMENRSLPWNIDWNVVELLLSSKESIFRFNLRNQALSSDKLPNMVDVIMNTICLCFETGKQKETMETLVNLNGMFERKNLTKLDEAIFVSTVTSTFFKQIDCKEHKNSVEKYLTQSLESMIIALEEDNQNSQIVSGKMRAFVQMAEQVACFSAQAANSNETTRICKKVCDLVRKQYRFFEYFGHFDISSILRGTMVAKGNFQDYCDIIGYFYEALWKRFPELKIKQGIEPQRALRALIYLGSRYSLALVEVNRVDDAVKVSHQIADEIVELDILFSFNSDKDTAVIEFLQNSEMFPSANEIVAYNYQKVYDALQIKGPLADYDELKALVNTGDQLSLLKIYLNDFQSCFEICKQVANLVANCGQEKNLFLLSQLAKQTLQVLDDKKQWSDKSKILHSIYDTFIRIQDITHRNTIYGIIEISEKYLQALVQTDDFTTCVKVMETVCHQIRTYFNLLEEEDVDMYILDFGTSAADDCLAKSQNEACVAILSSSVDMVLRALQNGIVKEIRQLIDIIESLANRIDKLSLILIELGRISAGEEYLNKFSDLCETQFENKMFPTEYGDQLSKIISAFGKSSFAGLKSRKMGNKCCTILKIRLDLNKWFGRIKDAVWEEKVQRGVSGLANRENISEEPTNKKIKQ